MKNIGRGIIALAVIILGCAGNSQTNNFTVSGSIEGLDSEQMFIYLEDETAEGGIRVDTIKVNNKSFTYTSPIREITSVFIWPDIENTMKRVKGGGYYPVKSSQLQFIASPGASIKFTGKITDFVDAYPSGDEPNISLAQLNKEVFPLMNQSVNLKLKIANKEVTDSLEIENLNNSMKELDEEVLRIKEKFISNNPSSVAAIWLLSDMMLRNQVSNEKATGLFNQINREKLMNVPYYQEVAQRVHAISATANEMEVPGVISSHTFDGDKFDLLSLRGTYVVLDFWGTWCGPCIAGMPKLKEYREKYKNNLEIVGIAQESDKGVRWRKFLMDNPGYQWPQVLNIENEENFILKFNVSGFPTKIIIDPEGKIVGRYMGEDDAIYKKLDELLE